MQALRLKSLMRIGTASCSRFILVNVTSLAHLAESKRLAETEFVNLQRQNYLQKGDSPNLTLQIWLSLTSLSSFRLL